MQRYYYELTVTPSAHRELFAQLLLELTQDAIEERDTSLIVRSEAPLEEVRWAIETFSQKSGIAVEQNLKKRENVDWIERYKRSIRPIEVGSFFIRPEWEPPKPQTTDIIINPALAFGSGHHESTSGCLQAIDRYVTPGMELLDVGCGSGILSIAAAKKGAIVDLCDTDPDATRSARENFALNDVRYRSSWTGSAAQASSSYDLVVANIIADVILMIRNDLKKALRPGGILILSGIIDKYFTKIEEHFSDLERIEHIHQKEWHTFVLRKG